MTQTVAAALSSLVGSVTFLRNKYKDRYEVQRERIQKLVYETMPSGSGFDSGTAIDLDESTPNKLIFHTIVHHMNEDRWTTHKVTVTPDFVSGVNVKVSGRNRNDIKDYIGEVFSEALEEDAPFDY